MYVAIQEAEERLQNLICILKRVRAINAQNSEGRME